MSFELILPFLRPIEGLLLDDSISEIMGNPDSSWWCELDGKMQHEDAVSFDASKLLTGLEVIANQLGKKLDEDNPSLHVQLPDGSRLAAWIPPIVRPSPALAIRKFTSRKFTIDDLIQRGKISRTLAQFLGEQISNGKTLLISGGTGTGKTTLLRILADFIPDYERIVVIEDTPELHIRKPNIVAAGSQTNTFKSNVSFDDLLKDALRFRPDRVILGEVRGIEARTLLDSFNTGHSGSLATIHANSAEKSLCRFANLVMRGHGQTTFSDTEAEIAGPWTSWSMWNVSLESEPFEKSCDSMGMTGALSSFGLNSSTEAKQPPFLGVSPMYKCHEIARQFLSEWFAPEDTFAFLIRQPESSRTLQRILRLSDLMKSNYLGWLAFENSRGANIYFSINPLAFGATKRAKSAVAAAKGLYLDLDSDGDRKLAAVRESNAVPPPSAVIHTSVGKYQVIWRVKGFRIPEQEAALKALAEAFGGDRACTDCARMFRLPGFFNRKYTPAFPVTSEMGAIQSEYSPRDFRLELPMVTAVQPSASSHPKALGSQTRSESDWRWVMGRLSAGISAQEIIQTLAHIRSDKPNPAYYARRTVHMVNAVRWVRKGIDCESVIECLKKHDPALLPDRAAEIATTASRFVQRTRVLHSKEN